MPTDRCWIQKKRYRYTTEYYSPIRENDILPFATTWKNLEGIRLSEVSQKRTHTIQSHLYVGSKKENK